MTLDTALSGSSRLSRAPRKNSTPYGNGAIAPTRRSGRWNRPPRLCRVFIRILITAKAAADVPPHPRCGCHRRDLRWRLCLLHFDGLTGRAMDERFRKGAADDFLQIIYFP